MTANCLDVTVVIPLFNHEKYIADALDSVYRQTVKIKEIIVVDDGSSDASLDIVKKYFGKNPNLVIWTKPNSGAHHSINAGIYRATSKYISVLNSDDIYDRCRIENMYNVLESYPDTSLVATGVNFIDSKNKPTKNIWYENAIDFFKNENDLSLALINANFFVSTSNFFIRKSVFESVGYFENYRYAHDLAFLLKLISNKQKIIFEPKEMLFYRSHETNTISEGVLKVKLELALIVGEYIFNMISCGQPIDWHKLIRLQMVLDEHNLARLVYPVLMARMSNLSGQLTANPKFINFMTEIVK